ncbi:MAG: tetratricopeptide repeat protein [Thermogutta sp.]
MNPEQKRAIFVSRKVREAAGYVELGLLDRALECLNIPDLGPWEGAVSMFRGQILAAQGRFRDAAVAFERAAELFPPPHDRVAWLTLSHCLRQTGDTTRAIQVLGRARGAFPRQLFLPDSGMTTG